MVLGSSVVIASFVGGCGHISGPEPEEPQVKGIARKINPNYPTWPDGTTRFVLPGEALELTDVDRFMYDDTLCSGPESPDRDTLADKYGIPRSDMPTLETYAFEDKHVLLIQYSTDPYSPGVITGNFTQGMLAMDFPIDTPLQEVAEELLRNPHPYDESHWSGTILLVDPRTCGRFDVDGDLITP